MKLPMTMPLENSSYEIEIHHIFRNATVVGRDVIENEAAVATEWGNPAIQLIVRGEKTEEEHTAFSNFPDFASFHGTEAPASEMKVLFHAPDSRQRVSDRELRFFVEDGRLMYQVKDGEKLMTQEVQLDQENPVGWMNFNFRIEEYFPHSQRVRDYQPRANTSSAAGVSTVIRLGVKKGDEEKSVWIREEGVERVILEEKAYDLFFGSKRRKLGFTLELIDFKKEDYPGTNKAMGFSSDAVLRDGMRGVEIEQNISMNEPLEYRGYKIYQSAFRQNPGRPEVSIFSVGHDPGIPLNYLGSIIMVSGVAYFVSLLINRIRIISRTQQRPLG